MTDYAYSKGNVILKLKKNIDCHTVFGRNSEVKKNYVKIHLFDSVSKISNWINVLVKAL